MLTMTQEINNAFYNNEFQPYVYYGPWGYGKSTLMIHTLSEVYGKYEGGKLVEVCLDWNKLKNYIFFNPKDFLSLLETLSSRNQRLKCIGWDDAGFWLFQLDYADPFVKAISKFMQVCRPYLASVIFTSPEKTTITKQIRGMRQLYSTKILKSNDNKYESHKYLRHARTYQNWISEDGSKHGVWKIHEDDFSCKIPDDMFAKYQEIRKSYVDYGIMLMKKELEMLTKRGLTTDNFTWKNLVAGEVSGTK